MKLYKLTDANNETRGNTLWGENVTHEALRGGDALCSGSVIHAYRTPYHAVFLNSLHANFKDPILWEAEGDVIIDDGTKVGCKKLTTIKRISIPCLSRRQILDLIVKMIDIVKEIMGLVCPNSILIKTITYLRSRITADSNDKEHEWRDIDFDFSKYESYEKDAYASTVNPERHIAMFIILYFIKYLRKFTESDSCVHFVIHYGLSIVHNFENSRFASGLPDEFKGEGNETI